MLKIRLPAVVISVLLFASVVVFVALYFGTDTFKASEEIGVARAHGDLRENAEYKAAKEAQALNEQRIAELESKLAGSQILDDSKIPKDEALMGATLKLKDMDSGEDLEYTLVSELESDFSQSRISVTSPLGKGLLGHKKGQVVKIEVPAGTLRYKIVEISRS